MASTPLAQLAVTDMMLVLSDLRMPKMGGIELLRELRMLYPDVAVVMITGSRRRRGRGQLPLVGRVGLRDQAVPARRRTSPRPSGAGETPAHPENREYQDRTRGARCVQARRLEELFLASIQSLAEALEIKDPYTRGHSVRVSHYSSVIARGLKLDAEMIRQIELGGHVHDLGKIGVREAVLNKPGPLTAEEYQHIMTHPVLGWRILGPLLTDTPHALNIVRSHHERFDGRGIPDGLSGDAIPLEARIAAAADSLGRHDERPSVSTGNDPRDGDRGDSAERRNPIRPGRRAQPGGVRRARRTGAGSAGRKLSCEGRRERVTVGQSRFVRGATGLAFSVTEVTCPTMA
jgi:CheY-like chemotaxis protein